MRCSPKERSISIDEESSSYHNSSYRFVNAPLNSIFKSSGSITQCVFQVVYFALMLYASQAVPTVKEVGPLEINFKPYSPSAEKTVIIIVFQATFSNKIQSERNVFHSRAWFSLKILI